MMKITFLGDLKSFKDAAVTLSFRRLTDETERCTIERSCWWWSGVDDTEELDLKTYTARYLVHNSKTHRQ